VAHVALPGHRSGDLVADAIASNIAVLNAAEKAGIKRIVMTSSSVAVISNPDYFDRTLTSKDWNQPAIDRYEAGKKDDPRVAYAAAKTLAEKAAWTWVETEKPHFELVSVNPNANYGPVLHGESRSTAGWIYSLLHNETKNIETVPSQWYVDVRDDAKLHILGLTKPELGGERILAFAGPYGWNDLLHILRKNFPNVKVPEDTTLESGKTCPQKVDSSLAEKVLGGWIPLEKSVVDTAKSFGY